MSTTADSDSGSDAEYAPLLFASDPQYAPFTSLNPCSPSLIFTPPSLYIHHYIHYSHVYSMFTLIMISSHQSYPFSISLPSITTTLSLSPSASPLPL